MGGSSQAYFFDYDNDGWKDIFTANSHVMGPNVNEFYSHLQYLQPLLLFRNLANGKFEDVSSQSGEVFVPHRPGKRQNAPSMPVAVSSCRA